MQIERTNTLGVRVDALPPGHTPLMLDHVQRAPGPKLVTFVNPASIAVARRDPSYPDALERFDVVLPDGVGMCWAIRLLHGVQAERVSFDTTSLAPVVLQRAQQHRLTVAIVGGRPGVAERGARQLQAAFPDLSVATVLDGYGAPEPKIEALIALAPSVVVCGMGAPVQEKFLLKLAAAGWCGVGFTCGGYLDQLANGLHYYPAWINAANLRWAYRIVREPRRLIRRYGVDYALFGARLARALLPATNSISRVHQPFNERTGL